MEREPSDAELLNCEHRHQIMLATAENMAANGRLFMALVAVTNIAAGHFALGILAASPIGLSVLIDQIPHGRERTVAALSNYALAAVIAILSFVMVF